MWLSHFKIGLISGLTDVYKRQSIDRRDANYALHCRLAISRQMTKRGHFLFHPLAAFN